jgi:hypothetical protein
MYRAGWAGNARSSSWRTAGLFQQYCGGKAGCDHGEKSFLYDESRGRKKERKKMRASIGEPKRETKKTPSLACCEILDATGDCRVLMLTPVCTAYLDPPRIKEPEFALHKIV